MPIALTDERRELFDVARTFLANRGALAASRALLEGGADERPPFWDDLVSLGWLGLHLPEDVGGSGFGFDELAVVLEALGGAVAPGPFLPAVVASAIIDAAGSADQRARWLPAMADGTACGAIALGGTMRRGTDGALEGTPGIVLGAPGAAVIVARAGDDIVLLPTESIKAELVAGIDPTRPLARLDIAGGRVEDADVIPGAGAAALAIARTLAAAEAAGGAAAALQMALEYAKVREQFGRIIGSFQAVKHHLANMLVDSELAAAVAWDAARAGGRGPSGTLAGAVAAVQALPAFWRVAEKNIQILGGIGFTWEHDAHVYLRRASALAALFGASAAEVTALVDAGVTGDEGLELPEEAERYRAEAATFRRRYEALPAEERLEALIESGYLMPHWPKPFGRGAGAVEQLVIDEELPDVERPMLGIGTWVLLTLIQHGSAEQVERWIEPSLRGEMYWCQLFSEPNAGSDAAAIQSRATRVDGGWLISGQKVWTSGAQRANMGLATVRTDPAAAKHAGVSTMVVDLRADGVEVRPIREITGEALFNEVFFDDVFVPDDDVVGKINQGWAVARATLGNERVSIGGNLSARPVVSDADLLAVASRHGAGDPTVAVAVGELVAESHALRALNLRQVMRAVVGAGPGPEGAVTKLVIAEHHQRASGLAVRIAGEEGVADGEPRLQFQYLFDRCATIAGGTSEIARNIIAERILGLPREKGLT